MKYDDTEPISWADRAILANRLQKLANSRSMAAASDRKLADNPTNTFERNRDFIRSGVPWLMREALQWAMANQSWVEVVCNEQGSPIDLEVYF